MHLGHNEGLTAGRLSKKKWASLKFQIIPTFFSEKVSGRLPCIVCWIRLCGANPNHLLTLSQNPGLFFFKPRLHLPRPHNTFYHNKKMKHNAFQSVFWDKGRISWTSCHFKKDKILVVFNDVYLELKRNISNESERSKTTAPTGAFTAIQQHD